MKSVEQLEEQGEKILVFHNYLTWQEIHEWFSQPENISWNNCWNVGYWTYKGLNMVYHINADYFPICVGPQPKFVLNPEY